MASSPPDAKRPGRPDRRSLGVTAPSVARTIASAVSRDTQALSPLQSWVMAPGVTPIRRAKAPRISPFALSQSASFIAKR